MKALNKFQVAAIRATALHAIRAALPKLPASEIVWALGLKASTVRHHLSGAAKIMPAYRPRWGGALMRACALLAENRTKEAAGELEKLARELR